MPSRRTGTGRRGLGPRPPRRGTVVVDGRVEDVTVTSMREDGTRGRVVHPADGTPTEGRGADGADDDLWWSVRTPAAHDVVPAPVEVRRWAWDVTR